MTYTVSEPLSLIGRLVFDADGQAVGPVRGVYLDRQDRQPQWVALQLANARLAVAPLDEAVIYEDSLQIPFSAAQIEGSPHQTARLSRVLSEAAEADLNHHYGPEDPSPPVAPANGAKDQTARVASAAADQAGQVAATAKARAADLVATTKNQGQEVAQSATGQAAAVVDTAKQQAAQVVAEVADQAQSLIEEAKTQLQGQAEAQTARLAETLRQLSRQAQALAEGRPAEAPTVEGYVSQAAEQLAGLAERLNDVQHDMAANGAGVVLDDLKSFARRRPAVFLVGAMLVGFGGVRLLQGEGDQRPAPAASAPSPTRPAAGRRPGV